MNKVILMVLLVIVSSRAMASPPYETRVRNAWPDQFKSSDPIIKEFADYAINIAKKVDGGEMTSAEADKLIEEKRLAGNKKYLEAKTKSISCIFESPGVLAGSEIRYAFNESAKTLLANSGNKPKNVMISPKEIAYRTSGSDGAFDVVSISRKTGRFTVTHHDTEIYVVGTGACHVVIGSK